ncbi:unnamed protein product [Ectocarpus sp. CCAP 1310/34]|nr:unnamed protein product [Ectocarpus sp. CCAP 1310/34]
MVMVSAAIRPLGLVVLAALAASTSAQSGSNCEVSDLDEYEFMHSPTHGFIIYWTHDTDTVSFMVEAESEQWTAVGFSPDGDMVGSDAVIYRPEDEEVSEQFLDAQSEVVLDRDEDDRDTDELSDIEFSQDGDDTTFSFTRNTTPDSSLKQTLPEEPGSQIHLIWALGNDNAFGYHGQSSRGSFQVDLFCPGADGTPAPSAAATVSPTVGGRTPAPSTAAGATPAPTEGVATTPAPSTAAGATPAPTAAVATTPAPSTAAGATPAPAAIPATTTAPAAADVAATPQPTAGSRSIGTTSPSATVTTAPTEDITTLTPEGVFVPISTSSPSASPTAAPTVAASERRATRAPISEDGSSAAPTAGSRDVRYVSAAPSLGWELVSGASQGGGWAASRVVVASAVTVVCLGFALVVVI